MYGHQKRLSWPESPIKIDFWVEIMIMLYTTNKTKQQTLGNSIYLLTQARFHKIAGKMVAGRKNKNI